MSLGILVSVPVAGLCPAVHPGWCPGAAPGEALLVPRSSWFPQRCWSVRKPKGRAVTFVSYCSHLNSKRTDFLVLHGSAALVRCQLGRPWEMACDNAAWRKGTAARWCPEPLVCSTRHGRTPCSLCHTEFCLNQGCWHILDENKLIERFESNAGFFL